MLKKTITYEDFNGEMRSEDFYFHLSPSELVELELRHSGGLKVALERIIATEDGKGIVEEFKYIIEMSYGERSADGRKFIKSQALRDDFISTGAYSALFMELVLNTDKAIEFINGIVPADFAAKAAELALVPDTGEKKEVETVTKAQMDSMSTEQLQQLGTRIASGEVKIAD